MTKPPIHILYLDVAPKSAPLMRAALEAQGIANTIACVENREDFLTALERGGVDLILADFSLPMVDGLTVAAIARKKWPTTPLILVSSKLDETTVVNALKSGATDYVLKDNLVRLGPAVIRAMQDVEDRLECRRVEAQFIQSQKLEVIGQLAAGVAHDFNNILMIISGYNDFLSVDVGADSPLQKHTEHIRQALDRAGGLTRQLLVISQRHKVCPIVMDLNEAVKGLENLLRQLIDEKTELVLVPVGKPARVKADSGYIGQVLMNLVVNARHAMPDGGRITIAIANATLDETRTGPHQGVHPGEFVTISVSDTGEGMTSVVKAHLFEAFFTTKPLGKGTGLGLSTCKTIVQQSGGFMEVRSEVGQGATMTVCLPRVELPLGLVPGQGKEGSLPRGVETVLVVEDEPSVRRLACSILEARGYKVLSAVNGQDALQVAEAHQGSPIRLVVSDLVMPAMGGRQMAAKLRSLHPGIKILFSSGYSDDAPPAQGEPEKGVEFLPKPYRPASLSHKVREMLDAGGPESPPTPTTNVAKGGG